MPRIGVPMAYVGEKLDLEELSTDNMQWFKISKTYGVKPGHETHQRVSVTGIFVGIDQIRSV
jgi:uncharacterized protein YxjI